MMEKGIVHRLQDSSSKHDAGYKSDSAHPCIPLLEELILKAPPTKVIQYHL